MLRQLYFVCIGALAATVSLAQVGEPLFPVPSYGNSGYPYALISVDQDGDGRLDLVSTDVSNSTVRVLRGNGHGVFAPVFELPVASYPQGITAGDFDRDGRMDFAVAARDTGAVAVLHADANGGFDAAVNVPVGSWPRWITSADFNGDQWLDLAVVNSHSANVAVLLNDGSGGFLPATFFAATANPKGIAVGDLDSDSILDLVTLGGSQPQALVMRGVGDGTFGAPSIVPLAYLPKEVVLADVDGDAHLDLVASTSHLFEVHLGDGAGSFGSASHVGPTPYQGMALAVGDVNDDDLLDVLVAFPDDYAVAIALGQGAGQFAPPLYVQPGAAGIALGNFNGDTRLDLAAGNSEGRVSVLLNDGTNRFGAPERLSFGSYTPSARVADIDGDLVPDISYVGVDPSGANKLYVTRGLGNGQFGATIETLLSMRPLEFVNGDFNADGYPDFAIRNYISKSVSIVLSFGAGLYGSPIDIALDDYPVDADTGDLDGDGDDDLTLLTGGHKVQVLLSDGIGGFVLHGSYSTGSAEIQRKVLLGDFDEDGHLDLMTFTISVVGAGTRSLSFGDGQGGFGAPSTTALASAYTAVSIADLDGDGHLDILRSARSPDEVRALYGDGHGNFPTESVVEYGRMFDLRAVDMNADGRLDVIGSGDEAVQVSLATGARQFALSLRYIPQPGAIVIGACDINGDQRPDIVTLASTLLPIELGGYVALSFQRPAELFASYCTSSVSTHGCAPNIHGIGVPSASAATGFTIAVDGLEGQKFSGLFYGVNGRTALPWGVASTSTMCVRPPWQRVFAANSGGTPAGCDGSLSVDLNAYLAANPSALGQPLLAGLVLDAQAWFRDPPAPRHSNLSNALELQLVP